MITFSINLTEQEVSFWMYSRTLRLTITPKKKTSHIIVYPTNSLSLKEPSRLLDFNRPTTVKWITQCMRSRSPRLVIIWTLFHSNTEAFNNNKEMIASIQMTLLYPVIIEFLVSIPTKIITVSASYLSILIKRVLRVMCLETKPCW